MPLAENSASAAWTGSLPLTRQPNVKPFVVVSMYSLWPSPHSSTGSSWIVSDASVHRVISDLSTFIGIRNCSATVL